jgi:hypothetical protein
LKRLRVNPIFEKQSINRLILIGNIMTSITVTGVPAAVPAPRGAEWAARGAVAVWRLLSHWAAGRRAEPSSATHEAMRAAAAVRAMAQRYAATDPGFAADLRAAADRHETGPTAR